MLYAQYQLDTRPIEVLGLELGVMFKSDNK
jgi:hypothetical protein